MSSLDEADELDLSGIATYLSDLSQEGQLPAGVGPPSGRPPFTPTEVDLRTNDWVSRVVAVQAWLCLDSPVESAKPKLASAEIMRQVSPDPVESCLRVDGDVVLLRDLGAQHLETWLSRAVAHREAFEEILAEDRSHKDASEEWHLLWEEESTLARELAPINAQVGTWPIKHLSDYAKEDKLELNPSYQRDSVWSVGDSQLLIESILRGIPLPSIILTTSEEEGKSGADKLQIVDGKQRLTAILRFIGRHPLARRFTETRGDSEEFHKNFHDYLKRHHLKSRDIAEHCLPFKLRIYPDGHPLAALSGKYYSDILNIRIPIATGTATVAQIFDSVTSKYKIPVIIYEQTRLQDIHDVFSLYNKQGKKLNAEELRNATFHHLGLTRLLLALSGDRPDHRSLAPYLPPDVQDRISEIGDALKDLGFGTVRFKRTKVLSWTCSILLHRPGRPDGPPATPSTKGHINAMLSEIAARGGEHPMFHAPALVALARDLKTAIVVQSDAENAWHPKFRNKVGTASRWEELPLVASLLATLLLVSGDCADRLRNGEGAVRRFTEANPGPTKTQNKTQWEYIARIVVGVLKALDVDCAVVASRLDARYGYNCLETMRFLAGASP